MHSVTLEFTCPRCAGHLSVAAEMAEVEGPCPYCGSTIAAPRPHRASRIGTPSPPHPENPARDHLPARPDQPQPVNASTTQPPGHLQQPLASNVSPTTGEVPTTLEPGSPAVPAFFNETPRATGTHAPRSLVSPSASETAFRDQPGHPLPRRDSHLEGTSSGQPARRSARSTAKPLLLASLLLNACLLLAVLATLLLRKEEKTPGQGILPDPGTSPPAGSSSPERQRDFSATSREPTPIPALPLETLAAGNTAGISGESPGLSDQRHKSDPEVPEPDQPGNDRNDRPDDLPELGALEKPPIHYQRTIPANLPVDTGDDFTPSSPSPPDIAPDPAKTTRSPPGMNSEHPPPASSPLHPGSRDMLATDTIGPDDTFPPPATDPSDDRGGTLSAKVDLRVMQNFSDDDKKTVMSALATLRRYLAAESWRERAALARNGATEKGHIRSYYASRDPGPITALSIQLDSLNEIDASRFRFVIFNVRTAKIPEGFPVIVDEEDGGFKVAWRIFAEFQDDLLAKFMSGWQDEPESFHVFITRKHYLSNDIADRDSLDSFLIQTPVPGREVHVFADPDSEIAKSLSRSIPWGTRGNPVIRLKWTRGSDGRPYIAITDVESYSWGEN